MTWTSTVSRQNSLTSHISSQSKICSIKSQFTKNNSPTMARKQGCPQPKSINTIKDASEKSLPKINLEEYSTSAQPEKMSKLKNFMLMIEPKGYMKERDEFSLYLFPPNNRFRKLCHWIVDQKWFDNVVLLFIAMNCITLAMERPNIPPDSTERFFLSSTNYLFTVVFGIEMFIKVAI